MGEGHGRAQRVIDHQKPLDAELAVIGFPEVHYVASLSGSETHLRYFPKIIAPRGNLVLIDDPQSFDIVSLKRKIDYCGVHTR